jgi:hypothetical protein
VKQSSALRIVPASDGAKNHTHSLKMAGSFIMADPVEELHHIAKMYLFFKVNRATFL